MGTTSRHHLHLRRLDTPTAGGWRLVVDALDRCRRGDAASAAAALAFHASWALACALGVAIALLALWLGPNGTMAASGGLAAILGPDAAAVAARILLATVHPPHAAGMALLGTLGVLAGAAGVLGQLRSVRSHEPAAMASPVSRTAGIALVLAAGGVVLGSLVLGTALWMAAALHGPRLGVAPALAGLVDAGLTAMFAIPVLAALLRWLPDTPARTGEAWKGAVAASVPIVLGKVMLSGAIAAAGSASAFAVAGMVLLTMLWLYGSALCLHFGAALAAGEEARRADLRHAGARPLRATPERVAANTPIAAAPPPMSLAAARARLRPPATVRRADDPRAPAVLLQFPTARRNALPPS